MPLSGSGRLGVVAVVVALSATVATVTGAPGADHEVQQVQGPHVVQHVLGPSMEVSRGRKRQASYPSYSSGCYGCSSGGVTSSYGSSSSSYRSGSYDDVGMTGPVREPQTSYRHEVRHEEQFVNNQPVYKLHHDRRFQDGRLVHDHKTEEDEDDLGFSREPVSGYSGSQLSTSGSRYGYTRAGGRNTHPGYGDHLDGSYVQSQSFGSSGYGSSETHGDDLTTDFHSEMARMREKLRRQMITHSSRQPASGTSHRSEVHSQTRYVNGKPVYVKNVERKYKDGQLVHNRTEEKGPDDLGTRDVAQQYDSAGSLVRAGSHGGYYEHRQEQQEQSSRNNHNTYPRYRPSYYSPSHGRHQYSPYPSYRPSSSTQYTQESRDSSYVYRPSFDSSSRRYSQDSRVSSAPSSYPSNRRIYGTFTTHYAEDDTDSSYPSLPHRPDTGRPHITLKPVSVSSSTQHTEQSRESTSSSSYPSYRTDSGRSSTRYAQESRESSSSLPYRPASRRPYTPSPVSSTRNTGETTEPSYPTTGPTSGSSSSYYIEQSHETTSASTHAGVPEARRTSSHRGSEASPDDLQATLVQQTVRNPKADHSITQITQERSGSAHTQSTSGYRRPYTPSGPTGGYSHSSSETSEEQYRDYNSRRTEAPSTSSPTLPHAPISSGGARTVTLDLSSSGSEASLTDQLLGTTHSRRRLDTPEEESDQYESQHSDDDDVSSYRQQRVGIPGAIIGPVSAGDDDVNNKERYDISPLEDGYVPEIPSVDNEIESSLIPTLAPVDNEVDSGDLTQDRDDDESSNTLHEYSNSYHTRVDDSSRRYDSRVDDSSRGYDSRADDSSRGYDSRVDSSRRYDSRVDSFRRYDSRVDSSRGYNSRVDDSSRGYDSRVDDSSRGYNSRVDDSSRGYDSRVDDSSRGYDTRADGSSREYDSSDDDQRGPYSSYSRSYYHNRTHTREGDLIGQSAPSNVQNRYDNSRAPVADETRSTYPGSGGSSYYHYNESRRHSSVTSGQQPQPLPGSLSSSSSPCTQAGGCVVVGSPQAGSRRTEVRTTKKYINGRLVGVNHHERQYENGQLIHENKTDHGSDELVGMDQSAHGDSQLELMQGSYHPEGYSQQHEVKQEKKFVNGQQVYDLHHERLLEDGHIVYENRTEKDEDDFGVEGAGVGHLGVSHLDRQVGGDSRHEVTQSQHLQQHVTSGRVTEEGVGRSSQTHQVSETGRVSVVPQYTSRRYETRRQQEFVDGRPVYDLQQERRFHNGSLVYEKKTELDEKELGSEGHYDALHNILAGNTLNTPSQSSYNRHTDSSRVGSYGESRETGSSYDGSVTSQTSESQSSSVHGTLETHGGSGSMRGSTSVSDGASAGRIRATTTVLGSGPLLTGSDSLRNGVSSYGLSATHGSESHSTSSRQRPAAAGCLRCVLLGGSGYSSQDSAHQTSHGYSDLVGGQLGGGYSERKEMNLEEHYEDGQLVHGYEESRRFQDGELVQENRRQYSDVPSQVSYPAALESAGTSYVSSASESSSHASGTTMNVTGQGSTTDVCQPNPCQNGGTCLSGLHGPICACNFGFKGAVCTTLDCPRGFCRRGGQCSIEGGVHVCQCRNGFTGHRCMERTKRHMRRHTRTHATRP